MPHNNRSQVTPAAPGWWSPGRPADLDEIYKRGIGRQLGPQLAAAERR